MSAAWAIVIDGEMDLSRLFKEEWRAKMAGNISGRPFHAVEVRVLGPDEVDPVTVERVLDAAGDYMNEQYGNTALHHPTDRARIRALASGGKP